MAVNDEAAALRSNVTSVTAVDGVVLQQIGELFRRDEVVDRRQLECAILDDCKAARRPPVAGSLRSCGLSQVRRRAEQRGVDRLLLVDEVPVGEQAHVSVEREALAERRAEVRELALPEDLPLADIGRVEEVAEARAFEPAPEPVAVSELRGTPRSFGSR